MPSATPVFSAADDDEVDTENDVPNKKLALSGVIGGPSSSSSSSRNVKVQPAAAAANCFPLLIFIHVTKPHLVVRWDCHIGQGVELRNYVENMWKIEGCPLEIFVRSYCITVLFPRLYGL